MKPFQPQQLHKVSSKCTVLYSLLQPAHPSQNVCVITNCIKIISRTWTCCLTSHNDPPEIQIQDISRNKYLRNICLAPLGFKYFPMSHSRNSYQTFSRHWLKCLPFYIYLHTFAGKRSDNFTVCVGEANAKRWFCSVNWWFLWPPFNWEQIMEKQCGKPQVVAVERKME